MNDNNSMTVYMVAMGENCEGAGYQKLHYTLDGAVETAKEWMERSTFKWERQDPLSRQIRSWAGGCDWIEITEEKILK